MFRTGFQKSRRQAETARGPVFAPRGAVVTNHYLPVIRRDFFTNRIEGVTVFLLIACNMLMIIPCLEGDTPPL